MATVNLCAVDNQSGWCRKCNCFCPATGGDFSCVQLEQEISMFDDEGDWDWEKYNADL